MVLTAENYYSKEANEKYMSVSQYKDFAGTYGKMACEFSAIEKSKNGGHRKRPRRFWWGPMWIPTLKERSKSSRKRIRKSSLRKAS